MKKQCKICNKSFETNRSFQILCGDEECRKLYIKRYYRRYYKINQQILLTSVKKYQQSEKGKAKINEYNKKNKEALLLKRRLYSQNEKYRSYRRKYMSDYNKTPEGRIRKKLYAQKRKDWKAQVIHNFTNDEWISKVKSTKGICPCCEIRVGYDKLQMDHIIPLSESKKGQIYTIDDVQPLCASCNLRNRFYQMRFL